MSNCCHHHLHDQHHVEPMSKIGVWITLFFALFMTMPLILFPKSSWITLFSLSFVSILLEAIPFMLLGALLGGIVQVFVPQHFFERKIFFERPYLSILLAGFLGLIMPVCECAIVPLIRRLLKKGMPLSMGISFLLAGPLVNPLVFLSTFIAYNNSFKVSLTRVVGGYFVSVFVAFCIHFIFKNKKRDEIFASIRCVDNHSHHYEGSFLQKMKDVFLHASVEFFDIARFLIIGAFLATLMQVFISKSAIVEFVSLPVLSILLMMVLALVLNLCSETDAFIAASFRGTPIPLSAQLAFMILGPMLDIKLISMYFRVFAKKVIWVIVPLVIATVLLLALFLHKLL